MTQATETFDSYDAASSNREDLSDLIDLVEQEATPFMSLIAGKAKATATFHEWQTDSLDNVDTSNAVIEGDEATHDATAATTRVGNYTQISDKVAVVSHTQEAVRHAGYTSEKARQVDKKMRALKRDMEAIMTRNQASVAGNGSTARKLGSLESWYTTNDVRGSGGSDGGYSAGLTVAATNGTQRAFTESLLKQAHRLAADAGATPDYLMVGTFNKQVVSNFTGGATRMSDDKAKKIINTVDVYIGDYGQLNVVWNPQQNDRTAHLLDSSKVAVAYLRPMSSFDLAKTGSTYKTLIEAEYTLEMGNEAGHAVIADLTTS